MQKFTVDEILKACNGELLSGNIEKEIKDVTTDSRNVSEGSLFVAIKGERFDGHDFIEDCVKKGAIALSERDICKDGTVIKVENTVNALGDIAREYLKKYRIPVVGVTGSVGKTSTKDMVAGVLSSRYNLLKSTGNHNNELGMPLTLFDKKTENDMAVLEMGMSAFGELHYLASVAKPDVAIITNIGMSHIENLGSQEGILKAKLEITDFFNPNNTLIVNGDDKFLKDLTGDFEIIKYGFGENCDIRAVDVIDAGIEGSHFTLLVNGKTYPIDVTAPGVHNVLNALAAIAAGIKYGISPEEGAKAVKNVKLTDMRLTIEKAGEYTIIKDFYNAAPDSIRASVTVLNSVKGHRKVAILGDILEMGEFAKPEHTKLGVHAASRVDLLLTAGENAKYIAEGAKSAGLRNVISFPDTEALAENVHKYLAEGDYILIKASRGMHFEKIYDKIK